MKEHLPNGAFTPDMARSFHWWWDEPLAAQLAGLFDGCSVVDFGCGVGRYVDYLNTHGVRCRGFDGIPGVEQLTEGLVKYLDLTVPHVLGEVFDWSLCLEVMEHVPRQLEEVALENLHRHNTRGIVLSWAIPGQGGNGHVNERPNRHAIQWLSRRGYRHDAATGEQLRKAASRWFVDTIMVFRR